MKKIMKLFVLVAAAAMALASCQKNEIDAPAKQGVHFTINAALAEELPEAKTAITDNGDGTYTPSWEGTEELGVLFSLPDAETTKANVVTFENKNVAGELASFQGSTTVTENGTFYSFYPASAFGRGFDEGIARLDLKQEQTPTATSFDPSCDILVARPYDFEVVEGNVTADGLEFKRIMSVLRIDLKTDFEDVKGDFVKSVSFTAGDVKIVGYARVKIETPDFTEQDWTTSSNKVTANYSSDIVSVAGEKNSVYLVIAPVTIPAGAQLTFDIETKNYTISKTVTAPEMNFSAGNVNRINLTIKSENCTVKTEDTSDYSGTYAILTRRTDTDTDDYYYMTNDLGTASTKRFTAENAGAELPEEGVSLGGSKLWEVSKSGEYYKVRSIGANKYITHTSGNSADLGDEGIDFTIEKNDEGTYVLSYQASDAIRYLALNGSTGNDYFAMYKSGQKQNLNLIPAVRGEEPSTLDATSPEEMDAAGGDGSFTFELTNPKNGVELTASKDADWITNVVVGDGVVTYKVAANETADLRNATVTLTYGELTVPVTITQKGKTAEGAQVWTLVTSASDAIAIGDQIVIVASDSDYALGPQEDNNRTAVSVTKSEKTVEIGDDVQIIEIKAGTKSGTYAFYTGTSGYLYAASSTANRLKTKTTLDDNGSWIISVNANGVATIKAQGTYTRNWLRKNTSSALFACYSSGQSDVSIYRLEGGSTGSEEQDPVQLTMSEITCSAQTENSLTFTWTAVENASGYEVTFNGGDAEVVTELSYTATGLNASTTYSISVKAVGNGTNYITSAATNQTGTTSAAQGGGDEGGDTTGGTHYVKVTSTPADWTGTYLIVYETGKVAFDGGLAKLDAVGNTVAVTISDNAIAATDAMHAASFTINSSGHIESASGKFVGSTSNTNALPDLSTASANTLSIDASGNFVVKSAGGSYLRFNKASDQARFRFYKSSSYTAQQAIQLYKLN